MRFAAIEHHMYELVYLLDTENLCGGVNLMCVFCGEWNIKPGNKHFHAHVTDDTGKKRDVNLCWDCGCGMARDLQLSLNKRLKQLKPVLEKLEKFEKDG